MFVKFVLRALSNLLNNSPEGKAFPASIASITARNPNIKFSSATIINQIVLNDEQRAYAINESTARN